MPSVWNRNGYIRIAVEQEHIDESMERNSSHCMTALAIQAAIPDARRIAVDVQTIRWTRRGLRYVFLTPHVCQDNIIHFDQGERELIRPFVLRMRPAYIARAGKRRRECPSNAELRGTGFTVNKVQFHIDGGEPKPCSERYTPTGERNLDPERVDGPPPSAALPGRRFPTPRKAASP
jgi:hypothetical protein